MAFFVFAKVSKGGENAGFRVMLKYFEITVTEKAFRYYIKQIDSMLPCVCSVIYHRRRQNVKTSVTHSATPRVALFCSYPFLRHL